MRCHRLWAVLCVLLLSSFGSARAERLTDEQVKKLIEDIDVGYKSWKQSLKDRDIDDLKLTLSDRTIDVKSFLKDFESDIDVAKDRFKPAYAASPEVLTLLRRGSDVELFNRKQGRTSSSEWTVLGAKFSALATAYGVAWPIESMKVEPARLNDGELVSRVEQMASSAKQVRGEADKAAKANKSIDKATRESMKQSIQQVETLSKDVAARLKEDRPAAIEVGQLVTQTKAIGETMTKLALPTADGPSWHAIESVAKLLGREFGIPQP